MKKTVFIVLAFLIFVSLLSGCAGSGTERMASLDDIADKRIGVYTGTVYDKFIVEEYPEATVLRYNTISDYVLALKNNKIDVAITNLYSAQNVIRTNPEIGILADDVLAFPIGIGFHKQNPTLRDQFNACLKELKDDGSYDAMFQKWFESDLETSVMPKFESNPAWETVVLGVADGDLPSIGYVNGEFVGFDIELVQTFAQKENLNLEIVTMDFAALVPSLAAGKVDMIADCIAITEERKEQVDFSEPYMEDQSAIIVLKNRLADSLQNNESILTMEDVAKMKVGVLLGSVHDSYMAQNYPDTQVLQYKSYPDLVLAVESGKADAGFITTDTLKDMQKEDDSLKILIKDVLVNPIGMGFQKDNDALREEFNAFLKEIKGNGVYDDWAKRWFEDGSTDMPAVPNKKNNGKLVVGIVSDKGMPYAVIKDNQLIGSDIELVERFGAYLGKEIIYSDMDFGNLIAAVSTNKIEMIASTLMITEERAQQIDFSDPYYELGASVFAAARKDEASGSFFQSVADSFYNNIIHEKRYILILDGLKTTGIISVFSIVFGTIIGALVCFMRMSKKKAASITARVYISILRGIPVLVLLMVIFYIVFAKVNVDPVFVAVTAFGLNFGAYVAEMFRTSIESIDKGQTEAGIAGGFTKAQTFIYIVLPQAIRQVLPVYKGEVISLVKMTSIVGYIAVQDLTKASDIIRSRTFDAFFPLIMTAVLYFAISALVIWLLNYVERRTDPRRKRREVQKNGLPKISSEAGKRN